MRSVEGPGCLPYLAAGVEMSKVLLECSDYAYCTSMYSYTSLIYIKKMGAVDCRYSTVEFPNKSQHIN